MAKGSNAPIIIKRKKVVVGGGHHGGAWKVAYADFVTAMMAFFMLMWLLNATTEQQRKGIADFFSPTIPINRISGGGTDALNGDSIFSEDALVQSGSGINQPTLGQHPLRAEDASGTSGVNAETASLRDIEAILMGKGGESMLSDQALRHIVTRLTDEGLVITLFDTPQASLFVADTVEPNPVVSEISGALASLMQAVTNDVAIEAHLRARAVVHRDYQVWDLSVARARSMMEGLRAGGLMPMRFARVAGHGDREPVTADPTLPRNNRIDVILLRQRQ